MNDSTVTDNQAHNDQNHSEDVPGGDVRGEEISRVMRVLGSRRTEAKSAAARKNVAKAAAANIKNPLDLPCTCTGGDSLSASDHRTRCPRGRLLYRRAREAASKNEA